MSFSSYWEFRYPLRQTERQIDWYWLERPRDLYDLQLLVRIQVLSETDWYTGTETDGQTGTETDGQKDMHWPERPQDLYGLQLLVRVQVLGETGHSLILADCFAAVHIEWGRLTWLQLCQSMTQFLTSRGHLAGDVHHLWHRIGEECIMGLGVLCWKHAKPEKVNTKQQATELRAANSDKWQCPKQSSKLQISEQQTVIHDSVQHRAASYRSQSNKQWYMTVSNTEQQATELRATNRDKWQCPTQSSKLQSSEQQTVTNDSVQHRAASYRAQSNNDKWQCPTQSSKLQSSEQQWQMTVFNTE